MTDNGTHLSQASDALASLKITRPELADILACLLGVVADEASHSPQFADALTRALSASANLAGSKPPVPEEAAPVPPRRSRRRQPGVLDPYVIHRDVGEDGLRSKLSDLNVEQLKDIIAQNAMDHDKLAMKWRTPKRLIDRIVEKTSVAVSKGSAFRS